MIKILFFLVIPGLMAMILGSCSGGPDITTGDEVVLLPDFKAVAGYHCESTSIMNALAYQGVHLSEAMINGFAAAPGFMLATDTPFPWIGSRIGFKEYIDNLSKATGFTIVEGFPENPQSAYDEVKALLKQGIPVVLQVNMRYLPYIWGGKYGHKYTSFGGHFVCIAGINEHEEWALVTDTYQEGFTYPAKIKITDLMKARTSEEGDPLMCPYMRYYYFDNPQNITIDYEKGARISVQRLVHSYKNGMLTNLNSFKTDIATIEGNLKSKYMLKPVFESFYGWIEEYGTGGAGFRDFLANYYTCLSGIVENSYFSEMADLASASANEWHAFADVCLDVSKTIETLYNNKQERKHLYAGLAEIAAGLAEKETAMYTHLKKYLATGE